MKFTLSLAAFLLLFNTLSFAGYDYKFESRENAYGQFESEISSKLTRGIINTATGWMEIFRTPTYWGEGIEHNGFSTAVVGVPYGMIRFVGRTFVGAYEVATCYVPQQPIFADIQGEVG